MTTGPFHCKFSLKTGHKHFDIQQIHFKYIIEKTLNYLNCNCNVGRGKCARQQRPYGTIGVVGLGSRARWGVRSGRG